jgi:hypothetical protein
LETVDIVLIGHNRLAYLEATVQALVAANRRRFVKRLLVVAVAALLGVGCGSPGSVLDAGVTAGPDRKPRQVGPAEAVRDVRAVRAEWLREVARRARLDPRRRFPNLAPFLFRQRLRAAARRYRFRVVSVRLLRPRQLAPEVVVQTTRYVELARAVPAIDAALNPRLPARDDRAGWEYEGFYLEARDERGVPFLSVVDFMRGRGPGGGQWARSDPLYPFPHG